MSIAILNKKIKVLEDKIEDVLLNEMNDLYDEKYKKEFAYFGDKLIKINQDIEIAWKTLKTYEIKALSMEKNISKDLLEFKNEFNKIGITTKSLLETVAYNKIKNIINEMQNLAFYYPRYKNIIHFRINKNLDKSFGFCKIKIIEIYDTDVILSAYNETVNKYFELRKELEEIEFERIKSKYEESKEIDKVHKIFNYKDMDIHLQQKGFEPVRQKGSHKIYTNGDKTTVVPQRNIGKGLSYKIQKQIMIGEKNNG